MKIGLMLPLIIPLLCFAKVESNIEFKMIDKPSERFSTRWAFIIDGSSSIWTQQSKHRLLDKVTVAFDEATAHPTDDMKFCIYLFGNLNRERYRPWRPGNKKEFDAAAKWMCKGAGIYSHAMSSFYSALHQNVDKLTIILITDGGFTSASYGKGFGRIEDVIKNGQAWREKNELKRAIICSIGIENKYYYGGGKPDDVVCQEFLRKIGVKYRGGYFIVRTKRE